jgi:hypothetical protein
LEQSSASTANWLGSPPVNVNAPAPKAKSARPLFVTVTVEPSEVVFTNWSENVTESGAALNASTASRSKTATDWDPLFET